MTRYNASLSWRIPGFHGPLSLCGPLNYIISVIFTTPGLPKVAQLVNSEPVVFKLFSRNSILFSFPQRKLYTGKRFEVSYQDKFLNSHL